LALPPLGLADRALAPLVAGIVPAAGRLLRVTLLEPASIFPFAASTIGVLLLTVGAGAPPTSALAAFARASVAGGLGLVRGAAGVYEAAAAGALDLLGVPLAATLAATLLLRVFNSWPRMLPELVVASQDARAR
jgi:uncharacterized membrane protein YbhN (UPF0104 family)